MSSFLQNLEWRHATKAFEPSKKVADADLAHVQNAIRMTPTSFGLQPFRVDIIASTDLKEKIAPLAWNQKQITTCSHLLVFSARTNVGARIDQYFSQLSGNDAAVRANFKDYEGMMHGSLDPRTPEQLQGWASKQAYIALGFALAACAELKLDSCPMEGFSNEALDKLLGFDGETKSAALLAIGYRDPAAALMPKFRFSQADLFHNH
jgi:nitroreductase / dihydropteridine reductase